MDDLLALGRAPHGLPLGLLLDGLTLQVFVLGMKQMAP